MLCSPTGIASSYHYSSCTLPQWFLWSCGYLRDITYICLEILCRCNLDIPKILQRRSKWWWKSWKQARLPLLELFKAQQWKLTEIEELYSYLALNIFWVISLSFLSLYSVSSLENLQHPLSPIHPNINMHILHTVLYTFLKVLMRRICLTIKSFLACWSFPLFSWPYWVIQG